jgi:hypothetical protein
VDEDDDMLDAVEIKREDGHFVASDAENAVFTVIICVLP